MGQHVSVDAGFGPYLRRLREERRWSLRRLGEVAHISHGHLWDLEKGRKQPSVTVAALLDNALDGGGQLAAMVRVQEPADGGLAAAVTTPEMDSLHGTLELWALDAQRQDFLAAAAFNASAFLTPALRWLTTPIAPAVTVGGPRIVGAPDVEMIRQMLGVFRTVDNQYGGGQIRERLVRFLHHDVAELLQGRYDVATGSALLSAAAEATQLAGWATYDVGRHALAQRYMVHALQLAGAAGDRPLGAEVLAAMSHQAAYLRSGGEAVDLARAAARAAQDAGVGAIAAEAAVLEAQGHAVGGDGAAEAAVLEAQGHAVGGDGECPRPRRAAVRPGGASGRSAVARVLRRGVPRGEVRADVQRARTR